MVSGSLGEACSEHCLPSIKWAHVADFRCPSFQEQQPPSQATCPSGASSQTIPYLCWCQAVAKRREWNCPLGQACNIATATSSTRGTEGSDDEAPDYFPFTNLTTPSFLLSWWTDV